MRDSLVRILNRLQERAVAENRRWLLLLVASARLLVGIWRQLVVDQCLTSASALAYTTLLALVPLLAVSFSLLRAFTPGGEMSELVKRWMLNTFLADSVTEISGFLDAFLERTQSGAVGVVGFLFLTVTAVSLFLSVERTVNRIWRVPTARPIHRRLTTFYAIITLGPALVGVGAFAARSMQGGLSAVPFGLRLASTVIPWGLEAAALTLLYKLMPHTRVRWRAALAAGLATAVVLETTKWGFNFYVARIYGGSVNAKVYGSFALVPLFCLWIYLNWIIVLAGVEVSYTVQNRRALTEELFQRRGRGASAAPPRPNGYLTSRVFFEVADHFRVHGGGVPIDQVAGSLQLPIDDILPVVQLLREGDLILLVDNNESVLEMVPARPLANIDVRELYELPSADGYQPGQLPADGPAVTLEDLLRGAQAQMMGALSGDVEALLTDKKLRADKSSEAAAETPKTPKT